MAGVSAQTGNSSAATSKTAGIRVKVAPRIRTEQRQFNKKPDRIISTMGNRPDAKTTMFGGVATGKQKAQLHAMAVGIMNV